MAATERQKYVVGGVCCSTEEGVLRRSLDGALGAGAYDFSLLTGELAVDAGVEETTVLRLVKRAGFQARSRRTLPPRTSFVQRHEAGLFAGAALALTIAGAIMEFAGAPDLLTRGTLLAAILLGGWRVALKAVKALRLGSLDMNVLMVAAVIGAIILGEWTEAAFVIVLFAVSLMLETYSTAARAVPWKSSWISRPSRPASCARERNRRSTRRTCVRARRSSSTRENGSRSTA